MKEKDDEFGITTLSFNDKIAMFDNNSKSSQNVFFRKSSRIEYNRKDGMISFGNKLNMFQPKKHKENNNNNNQYDKNISNKHEKKEKKYNIKKEKKDIKEANSNKKLTISKEGGGKIGTDNIFEPNKKKEIRKSPDKKISNISMYYNFGDSVAEKIRKLNQKEENNKTMNNNNKGNNNDINNNKNKIKSIEIINNFNNNNNDKKSNQIDKKNINKTNINYIENKDIINNTINSNKIHNNKNNNYIKEIKELSNTKIPKENKAFNNIQFFSQNAKENQKKKEQEKINKINNENQKKDISSNFKNIVAFFNNTLNKGSMDDNINQENDINEIIRRNSFHEKKKDKNKVNEIVEKLTSKNNNIDFSNKSNCSNNNNNNKEESKQIIYPISTTNNISTIKTENSIQNTLNNQEKLQNNNNQNNEISKNKKKKYQTSDDNKESTINIKNRSSKSLPKYKDYKNITVNKIDYIPLDNKIPINSETKTNSFCKAFFISSLSKKNNKIIEDSEEILADCEHKECSLFPAFEPEIIYKYPEKDSKELEVNNILASVCFPNNIKICYSNDEDKIYTVKNYRTCLTNQVGDRFYAMMYFFYVKMINKDFTIEYNIHLMEKLLNKYNEENNEKNEIDIINEINNRKYVYIPHCLGLISKYPYFSSMEKCLESILITLKNPSIKKSELNELITFLVKSIPSPYINTSVFFIIPYYNDIIEINPCFYQDLVLNGINPISLIDILSINNLIFLFRLLLFEQKILLISNNYDNLTKVSLNLISLLYPLSWVNIYIPILTEKMLKYLQSFLPFFSGMHKSLFKMEKVQNILSRSHKDLYIFDIDNNSFDISCNLFGKKKVSPNKFINKNIPNFPKKIERMIIHQLNILKCYYKNYSSDNTNYISNIIKMKSLFIQVFIELLYNYKKYLTIIGDLPVFNTNDFVYDKPENEKNFYKELTSTQLFQIFIQNSLHYMNNKNINYYFDELTEDYLDKKKALNNKIFLVANSKFEQNMNNKLYNIKKTYFIRPYHLKLFKAIEKVEEMSKHKKLFKDLKRDFEKRNINNSNENISLKENQRIVENNANISNKNDIKEYGYFITPEEEIDNQNEKLNSKENIESIDNNTYNSKIKKNKSHTIYYKNLNMNNSDDEDDDEDEGEEELSSLEKEDIRDNIRATLTRVFKSEKVDVIKDSTVLLSSIKKQYGRNYFVDMIEKNKNSKEVKIICGDSFKILLDVISKSLLKLDKNKRNLIYIIKLIKSCSYFKAIVNNFEYTLLVKIAENLRKNFKLFNEILFWELWIEDELNEKDLKILNNFKKINEKEKKNEYYYIDEDDEEIISFKENYKIHLKDAKNNMIRMKLNKSFILTVIEELCNNFLKDDDYQKQLVGEIMNI